MEQESCCAKCNKSNVSQKFSQEERKTAKEWMGTGGGGGEGEGRMQLCFN